MTYSPDQHRRRSIRLTGYDYSQNGAYFVTVCTKNRECLLGEIENGEMRLNDAGRIVMEEWIKTAEIRSGIELDACVVMPNHVHGIVVITHGRDTLHRRGDRPVAPTGPQPGSVGAIMAGFKSAVTKRINEMRQMPGEPLWQRNYYEHVIRNEDELNRIRQYINDNPAKWDMDKENPHAGKATAGCKMDDLDVMD